MNAHITDIYNRLRGIGGITVTVDLSAGIRGGIKTIVITNLPLNISRYFTKIRLNYNPINNKIHLRTNSADEDIANTFGIINNDKQFANSTDVIAFLNSIIYPKKYYRIYTNTFIICILILLILLIIFIIIYI